jgi:DNA-binding protein HU-beta
VLGAIATALAEGDKVALPGFGTFETRSRAARIGRNPRTGEALDIPASTAPTFKAAAALKRAVGRAS